MDFSNDTEHDAGKMGFPKNAILTKMWSIKEGLPVPCHVIAPSGTKERRSFTSSQSSRVCAHREVGMSGGDQKGEWVLKSLQSKRGPSGMGSEKRCRRLGRLSTM